jgi:hypothetical protein
LNGFPAATAGVYERPISVPKLPGGGPQVTQLAFEAVNWEAIVSVGPDRAHLQEAGRHLSAWTPFTVDISRYVTPGQTTLVRVHVRDRNSFQNSQGSFTLPAATEWNDRQARGIIRGVLLQVYPATYIANVFVQPNTTANTLTCDVTVVNRAADTREVTLSGAFTPWNRGTTWRYPTIAPISLLLAPDQTQVVRLGPVKWTLGRASWWWPNVPYRSDYRAQLHNLTVTMQLGPPKQGHPVQMRLPDTDVVRFGFCTPGQIGNTYTLNGVRINLRGDSLPEGTIGTDAFARLPGFLPPTAANSGWPGAVRNYLRLNFNVVRMHQVPCTRYMMDVCDEQGLLVIPETAIRGGGLKKEDITVQPAAFTTHLRELVLRDRNHPSVFKWSLENELFGAPETFIRSLYDTCMAADGTRPCSIDDNADYPSWPQFAVLQHYSQRAGAADAQGGKPRGDRPYGQGEYVWPQGNSPAGAIWFGLETRAMRAHDNADLRPYTLIDLWPGVIPGLHPTSFPDPHLPPDSLEQGGRSLLDPPVPWRAPAIKMLQRSLAPVAAYDPDYDNDHIADNAGSFWPSRLTALPAGQTVTRRYIVFNDEFSGKTLRVRIQPALYAKRDQATQLPAIIRAVTVPPGGHTTFAVSFSLPPVTVNTLLTLTAHVSKDDEERFMEANSFLAVPPGVAGAQAKFIDRDDQTLGNWPGIYGKQAFFVPIRTGIASFCDIGFSIRRGTGFEITKDSPVDELAHLQGAFDILDKASTVNDARVPLGGNGLTTRDPIVFTVEPGSYVDPKKSTLHLVSPPLILRVDTPDGKPHRLSLYCLDYKREGRAMSVDLYDLQGHPLESRRLSDFGNGTYMRFRITGSVMVLVTSLDKERPALSGAFLDPDTGEGLLWQP